MVEKSSMINNKIKIKYFYLYKNTLIKSLFYLLWTKVFDLLTHDYWFRILCWKEWLLKFMLKLLWISYIFPWTTG